MSFRRVILYLLFALIAVSVLILFILPFFPFKMRPGETFVAFYLVFMAASPLCLGLWSIAYLKTEPALARVALIVQFVLIILLVLIFLAPED